MLHQFENNSDAESFLKQNGKKFSQDCVTAMKLMYGGIKLNGDTCKELYKFSDRRLRECFTARPDVVKKEWKRDDSGKRLYVEYWIEIPKPPTKQSVHQFWEEYQNELPPTLTRYTQPNLF